MREQEPFLNDVASDQTDDQFSAAVSPQRRKGRRRGLLGLSLTRSMALVAAIAVLMSTQQVKAWWNDDDNQNNNHDSDHVNGRFKSDGGNSGQQSGSNSDVDASNDYDTNQKKISAMNVLLPISSCTECRKVKFELSATNGCYQWQNSHPQLVSMTDIHGQSLDHGRQQSSNECISRVFLEAKTLKETKSIILITARDINSGTVLKCNTKVGQVDRLDIFTRSKQFSVNSNQQLIVVGYDDDDNIFSSMDGFSFDWTITEGVDIIKKFSAPDTGSKQSHHTDYFFIRSMKAGFSTVSVKLEEPGHEAVKLVTKKLTVVDPFIILPAEPVYILPTSEFPFSLAHLDMEADGTITRPIQTPNPQFKWSTGTADIGSIKDDGKFRSKLKEGEATILVVDQQMKNNTAEGSINVVYPYRMEVSIKDVTQMDQLKKLHDGDDVEMMTAWSMGLDLFDFGMDDKSVSSSEQDLTDTHILIEEHYYRIRMHLYDKEGHKITLTDNLRFKSLNLESNWIELVKQNDIGSELVIKTKKITDETVKIASIHKLAEIVPVPAGGSKYDNFASRLTQEKELIITKPVKIQHPTNLVLLPFLPAAQETHGNGEVWSLSSKGGSGTYMWSIVDPKIASVHGSAQIKSIAMGKTQLICRDHKNYNNWDAIDVEVAQINQLSWVEEQIEIKARPEALPGNQTQPAGESRVLSLFAMDSKGRKFTNCTSVRPSFELKGETFVKLDQTYDSSSAKGKYHMIKSYVSSAENSSLLTMKQRFDEQPEVNQSLSLVAKDTPKLPEKLMKHHNFGICAQQLVLGETEGLSRVRASFAIYDFQSGPSRVLDSEFAEIAVYNPLMSVGPIYQPYMSDLYSLNQLGQEFQSFEAFFVDWQLTMQFGASLTWKVNGGSNFWPDQAENYETSWSSELASTKTSKSDVFQMKKLSIATTESEFELRCSTPENLAESQRAKITLTQASKSTRSLLRPAQHSTKVELHCEPPTSVKLLWAQDFKPIIDDDLRPLKQLPRSRIVQNERTHFVLVNSQHSVRYLMLDQDHKASFNSSSVLTNVQISDEAMAEVDLYDARLNRGSRSYSEDAFSGLYDKRSVQFKNLTGRVYLTAEASHFIDDFTSESDSAGKKESGGSIWGGFSGSSKKVKASDVMRGEYQSSINGMAFGLGSEEKKTISSQMAIEVVRNVDVEPKFKSLYIGTQQQTYKLRISHGSGAFAVSVNNTKLVDLVHKDRDIFLTPKDIGGLKVMVEDLELPSSEQASAELLISDIAKLTLWAPLTLIEKGDDMQMTVSAYDSFMREFDFDQYALMRFNTETETMGLRRTGGLQCTQVPEKNRNFDAYGREPGVYQLTAFTVAFNSPSRSAVDQHNQKPGTIVSEMLRIEVFPLLEIYPSNLLITPNMRYTLQIVGGPQTNAKSQHQDGSHVEIKFDIENTQVASIDRFREVTGHQVGDAILKYEIIQLRTQNNLQPYSGYDSDGKNVVAHVKPQSRVVSKKTVKIRVRLVTEIEIPFSHQRQIYSESLIKMLAVLKYNDEHFHHGVAPISYSWNVTENRVLNLDIPTKQELAQVHGMARNLVMTSRYIRDNQENRNNVEFFTSFNSSSIYANGGQEGETMVTCLLAIEYPDEYRKDKNWFKTSVNLKVTNRLSINVPQYSSNADKQTHLYLVPPHTVTKIETNKQTRLKLGYSQQSVFDYSTQSYKYQESSSPIIELVNDEAIKTFDKYGKVTLLVEEGGAFSDQMVMLNVKVTDVYTLSTMRSYDALNLPLGSSLTLPIHLQDEHAHMFAEKISGVGVGIYLSHPKVVQVSLDQYNQTLTIQSLGSGDCNIYMFLEEHPNIFDVIRVRVSGVVQPFSPVYIHLGGEINFRVESTDGTSSSDQTAGSSQVMWSSSNPSVLSIDSMSGKAMGSREGKADVLLSNHHNAASIVHVNKVAFAQLDQKSQLIINTDGQGQLGQITPEYRVRVRMFLEKQPDETMPTVQFDGITLIRQHIGIRCESDNTDFVIARGEVNDLEGFFCVMQYVQNADIRGMPRFVKVIATAFGHDANGKELYADKVTEFEMQLISEIKVETKYMNGVELCNNHRTESIRVFSSSDFKVDFQYPTPEEDGQLVLHQVTPIDAQTNEYNLTIQVPVQVSHSFDVNVQLSHQFASKPRILSLRFLADQNCDRDGSKRNQANSAEVVTYEGKNASGDSWFGSWSQPNQPTPDSAPLQQAQTTTTMQPSHPAQQESSYGIMSYLVFCLALVLVCIFMCVTFFDVDFADLKNWCCGNSHRVASPNSHRYNQQYGRYQTNMSMSGSGIRDSNAHRRQPLSRDDIFNSSMGKDYSAQSASGFRKARTNANQVYPRGGQGGAMHLDDFSVRNRADNQNQNSASRGSRYDSIQDGARYY